VPKSIVEMVSEYLGFENEVTLDIARKAPTSYKMYTIPKKKGGVRVIHHPSKQTKALQHALMETVLSRLPIHRCAFAYRRGVKSPLRRNAERHAPFSFTVRIDFKDFFPSIKPRDLFAVITRSGLMNLEESEKQFLAGALFVKSKQGQVGLAVGAPSSPIISNVVMEDLDEKIEKMAKTISTNSAYTRYADDIVFSTNDKGACKKFYKKTKSLIGQTRSPNLTIKEDKTVYLSRGTRRAVTGMTITPDHHISLGRRNKRYIRKLIFDCKNKELDEKKMSYLQGFLAYILDVEPDFYNKVSIKYGAETLIQILRQRKK
jgi:RNA-directed DNA polymerase